MAKKAKIAAPTTVCYSLNGAARAPRDPRCDLFDGCPPQPDLSDEFAARDPYLDPQYIWRGADRRSG